LKTNVLLAGIKSSLEGGPLFGQHTIVVPPTIENPSNPTNHGTGWTSRTTTLIWIHCHKAWLDRNQAHNQQTKILPDGIAPSSALGHFIMISETNVPSSSASVPSSNRFASWEVADVLEVGQWPRSIVLQYHQQSIYLLQYLYIVIGKLLKWYQFANKLQK
jgi:hypothetical protein